MAFLRDPVSLKILSHVSVFNFSTSFTCHYISFSNFMSFCLVKFLITGWLESQDSGFKMWRVKIHVRKIIHMYSTDEQMNTELEFRNKVFTSSHPHHASEVSTALKGQRSNSAAAYWNKKWCGNWFSPEILQNVHTEAMRTVKAWFWQFV